MPTIMDQRIFLPTRDLDQSVAFYSRLGWREVFRDDGLAMMELGASRIFLQKYYQPEWAGNTMVHFVVDDAIAWQELAERVIAGGGFGEDAKVLAAKRADYGALVTHVIDPAGVLLHFAQMDKA
jgi:catechol 2,3-dioxygenase-like lactoylglutathione lyase family enzyme